MTCCCALGEGAVTPCIQGTGPDTAPYLVVGQNPGGREDLIGAPFVGPSGTILRGMLADAGFKEGEYRLTNAVRCRTPRNRPPSPTEISACRPHLIEEIQRVQPKAIIALGDVALRALTRMGGLGGRRGRSVPLHAEFGYTGAEVYPTYHPAFVLRVPVARPTVVSDLTRARRAFEMPQTVFYVRSSSVPGVGGNATVAAYDIETDYWFTGGDTVIQAAVSTADGSVVAAEDVHKLLEALQAAQREGLLIVGHNSWAFDDRLTGVTSDYDTMALAYVDDESQPLGLEALSVKYLGTPGWKEEAKGQVAPGSTAFAEYNARDSLHTLRLYERLRERLGDRINLVDCVLRPAWQALLSCSKRGLFVSAEAVDTAAAHYEAEVKRLAALLPVENPNSPRQVAALLMDEGHVLPPTATGRPSTTDAVLSSLEETTYVRVLRDFRKASKTVNAFIRPYQKVVESPDRRVHPTYTLLRTATGRTSARDLNVQQLPRDPLIRAFFAAPPGSELVTYDYSAVEFRIAAWVAGERGVLDRYNADPNWDPHRYLGSLLYDIPEAEVSKLQRQVAKSANFGLLYMAQAPTLQEYARKMGVSLTLTEAAEIRHKWHEVFPAFRGWYADVAAHLFKEGYIETFTGRRRHFGDPSLLRGHRRGEALREAVNTHVQGPAADIALLGLVGCHQAGLPINGFFHDAISFEFPGGGTAAAEPRIVEAMTQFPVRVLRDHFGVKFTMPLTVDAKIVSC